MLILKHANSPKEKGGVCPALMPKMLVWSVAALRERADDQEEQQRAADPGRVLLFGFATIDAANQFPFIVAHGVSPLYLFMNLMMTPTVIT